MNDWTAQFEEMLKTWTEAQEKIWESFSNSMQGAAAAPGAKLWEQTVAYGEDMFRNMLKGQSDMVERWVDSLKGVEGLPEPALESAKEFRDMVRAWTKTQEQLVTQWFAMLRKLAPAAPTDFWGEPARETLKTWQAATRTILDSQMEWLRTWMKAEGKGGHD